MAVVAPPAHGPGVERVGPGVELAVGRCGGRVLVVRGAPTRADRVLDELRRRSVLTADVLVADGGRGAVALARDVAAVVRVRHRVAVGDVVPAGFTPFGTRRLAVGGVAVDPPDGPPPLRTRLSAVPCTVGP